jgi:hypothetical protein
MSLNRQYLGRVEASCFKLLLPAPAAGTYRRLTTMGRQVAQPPELQELHLNEYDDQIIMVRGYADDEWIWSAEVIEVAGPILTAVVEQVLGGAATAPELLA